MSILGGCFCGAVRYEIKGDLAGAKCCHCSKCRKIFSGASSAYAEVARGSCQWVRGAEIVTTYATGDDWGLCFCSRCGSTLAGVYGGLIHGVTLGSLDGDPDVQIAMHLFVGSKARWDQIGGAAVQYEEAPNPA